MHCMQYIFAPLHTDNELLQIDPATTVGADYGDEQMKHGIPGAAKPP
jgi:hypothetical protein